MTTLMLAALLLATVAPASAQSPLRSGHGMGLITSLEEISSRDAGGNRIAERILEGTIIEGPLQGHFREEVRGVVHRNGRVTFHGTMTFQGTVEGCGEVSLTARLTGRGQAGQAPVTEGTMTLVGRPGGATDVTGHGTVRQDGPLLTYQVQYICH